MPQNTKLLEIKDLVIHYVTSDGTCCAVNGVGFDLTPGETLGLVGETGAGKTTIARGILQIVPNPPGRIIGGEILFEGENLLNLTPRQMRKIRGKKISMIFQDPMNALNPVDTVGEQIAEVIRLHNRVGKTKALDMAKEAMELVGISAERCHDYPHQFSGGMKQRIVIAIALACNPSLLIADEPTTALDVTIQAQILDLINKLKKERGTSVLLITHDLGVVAEMCDRVAVAYAGQIIEIGSVFQIFDDTAHPYTKGLFNSLPSITGKSRRLTPIGGLMPDPTQLPKGCKFAPRCPYCTEACEAAEPELMEIAPGHYSRCILKTHEEASK